MMKAAIYSEKSRREDVMKKERIRLPKIKGKFRLLLYLVTLVFCALSVAETVFGYFPFAAEIAIYVIAAVTLTAACFYLAGDLKRGIRDVVRTVIEGNAMVNRVYSDYRYRTVLFTLFSFLLNLFYAASNGVYGIVSRSPWLGTLSAYYIFLSIMRYGVIRYDRKLAKTGHDRELKLQELQVYRNTGVLLSFITIVLAGAVILLVNQEGGKSYQGYMIFVVAMYTFYKAIISIINIIRARKMQSPLLVTIRDIGYADALVSVLSLQTAMFSSFGEESSIDPALMNGITGACVCTMTLAIGIYMICSAGRQRKRIQEEMQEGSNFGKFLLTNP